MNLPSGPRGRILALALLAIPVAIAYLAARPIWRDYQDTEQEIAATRERIASLSRIAALQSQVTARSRALNNKTGLNAFLVEAQGRQFAAAELQKRLRDQAQSSGGKVLSTRVLEDESRETEGRLEKIRLHTRLEIDLNGLQLLLDNLENNPPHLVVEMLSINARSRGRRRGGGQDAGRLDVILEIHGLRLADRPEADQP